MICPPKKSNLKLRPSITVGGNTSLPFHTPVTGNTTWLTTVKRSQISCCGTGSVQDGYILHPSFLNCPLTALNDHEMHDALYDSEHKQGERGNIERLSQIAVISDSEKVPWAMKTVKNHDIKIRLSLYIF